ncbi:MAG: hypothetical protein GY838_03905 [bacterium]|nr:hypothetical protein [bacterium]
MTTETTATIRPQLDAAEVLATGVDAASQPTVDHTGFSTKRVLNSTSSVPVTEPVFDTIALVAGAKTIDLTALVGTANRAVDGTGLKVQAIKFKNKTGNSTMSFTFGASNPYNLAGSDWKVTLAADQEVMFYLHNTAPDIAAGAKNIDVAGTLVEEFELSVVMG